jgi:hypothetical protein
VKKWTVKAITLDLDGVSRTTDNNSTVMSPTSGVKSKNDDDLSVSSDCFFSPRDNDNDSELDSARTFILKRKNSKAFPRRKKKKLNNKPVGFE